MGSDYFHGSYFSVKFIPLEGSPLRSTFPKGFELSDLLGVDASGTRQHSVGEASRNARWVDIIASVEVDLQADDLSANVTLSLTPPRDIAAALVERTGFMLDGNFQIETTVGYSSTDKRTFRTWNVLPELDYGSDIAITIQGVGYSDHQLSERKPRRIAQGTKYRIIFEDILKPTGLKLKTIGDKAKAAMELKTDKDIDIDASKTEMSVLSNYRQVLKLRSNEVGSDLYLIAESDLLSSKPARRFFWYGQPENPDDNRPAIPMSNFSLTEQTGLSSAFSVQTVLSICDPDTGKLVPKVIRPDELKLVALGALIPYGLQSLSQIQTIISGMEDGIDELKSATRAMSPRPRANFETAGGNQPKSMTNHVSGCSKEHDTLAIVEWQSNLARSSAFAASVDTPGVPTLNVNEIVEISGIGSFGGHWLTTGVTHRVDSSGFTTNFTCRKVGLAERAESNSQKGRATSEPLNVLSVISSAGGRATRSTKVSLSDRPKTDSITKIPKVI